jgi:hypothetical protein
MTLSLFTGNAREECGRSEEEEREERARKVRRRESGRCGTVDVRLSLDWRRPVVQDSSHHLMVCWLRDSQGMGSRRGPVTGRPCSRRSATAVPKSGSQNSRWRGRSSNSPTGCSVDQQLSRGTISAPGGAPPFSSHPQAANFATHSLIQLVLSKQSVLRAIRCAEHLTSEE